jgi:hypothetical protein
VRAQIADRASELDVDSSTGAMRDLYARHETDIAAARQTLAAQPGPHFMSPTGVGGTRPAGRPWALCSHLARLCAGYVADAIGQEPKPWQRLDAGTVLSVLAQGHTEPAPAVGLGEEYRLAALPGWPPPPWSPRGGWPTSSGGVVARP